MRPLLLPVLLAGTCLTPSTPAMAQDSAQIIEMRAEILRLHARLEQLEARLQQVESSPAPPAPALSQERTSPTVRAPTQAIANVAAAKSDKTDIIWKGAPQFSNGQGLSFKVRGRLELDSNYVSTPAGINAPTLGWASDVRRAYLGVDGTLGAGFGYRLELDFADGAQFTDAWLTYSAGAATITLGQHKALGSLDAMTSDLETSFLERPAFTQAFGLERRLGLSAGYAKGDIMIDAGVFSDDLDALGGALTNNSYSLDGRIVYMPKLGKTQLHLAASLHHRELQDLATTLRYRARPAARTTAMRFVDTGSFSALAERGYGLEFAAIHGPVHVAAEGFWQKTDRPGNLTTPTFFGSYGEIGYVFAGGKTRSYSNGVFGSIKPTRGLDAGGFGAWQINLRYDWLNLNDAGVKGGKQSTMGAALIWVPIDRVKFLANYLHIEVDDTPILAGGRSDYGADVVGLRAQYSF